MKKIIKTLFILGLLISSINVTNKAKAEEGIFLSGLDTMIVNFPISYDLLDGVTIQNTTGNDLTVEYEWVEPVKNYPVNIENNQLVIEDSSVWDFSAQEIEFAQLRYTVRDDFGSSISVVRGIAFMPITQYTVTDDYIITSKNKHVEYDYNYDNSDEAVIDKARIIVLDKKTGKPVDVELEVDSSEYVQEVGNYIVLFRIKGDETPMSDLSIVFEVTKQSNPIFKGSKIVETRVGEEFDLLDGVEVIGVDGSSAISDVVVTPADIDFSQPGIHTVDYKVKGFGNTKWTRTIIVSDKTQELSDISDDEKIIIYANPFEVNVEDVNHDPSVIAEQSDLEIYYIGNGELERIDNLIFNEMFLDINSTEYKAEEGVYTIKIRASSRLVETDNMIVARILDMTYAEVEVPVTVLSIDEEDDEDETEVEVPATVITANNFAVSFLDVEKLTESDILTMANATINVDGVELKADFSSLEPKFGIYEIKIFDENMTVEKIVNVVVFGEICVIENGIALAAESSEITLTDLSNINNREDLDAALVKAANIKSWNAKTNELITDISVDSSEIVFNEENRIESGNYEVEFYVDSKARSSKLVGYKMNIIISTDDFPSYDEVNDMLVPTGNVTYLPIMLILSICLIGLRRFLLIQNK